MLKKHSQFFENLLFLFDLTVIYAAWFVAYGLRFSGWPLPVMSAQFLYSNKLPRL